MLHYNLNTIQDHMDREDERERARDWGTSEFERKRQQEYRDEHDRRRQEKNRVQLKNRVRYTAMLERALPDMPLELCKTIQSFANPCFSCEIETCAPDRGCFWLHLREGSHPATMQQVVRFLQAQTFEHDFTYSQCFACDNVISSDAPRHGVLTEGCAALRYYKDTQPRHHHPKSQCPFVNCAAAYEWASHIKCAQCRKVIFRFVLVAE